MLKIRQYLLQVRNVFDFLDELGKKAYKVTLTAGAIAAVSVTGLFATENIQGANVQTSRVDSCSLNASSTASREIAFDFALYNVDIPEVNVDTVSESSIIEEVFLADASSDFVNVDLSNVKKEPEAVISLAPTNMVAAPVYTSKVVSYTEEDYQALLRIVEAEATGCDVIGKILVANVIINRVNSSKFPNTISGVIFSPNQFSPITDGRYYSVTIRPTTVEAVDRALNGEDYSQGALFFASVSCVNAGKCWAARHYKRLFEHDGHVFFGMY